MTELLKSVNLRNSGFLSFRLASPAKWLDPPAQTEGAS